jgi:N-acetyl-1-D-myo-inositol-2-amino-2-deoxy-alpha-D-glucopyranoside deacetylase
VLGVFAHPDDEVLCAGGTLALCAAAGQAVTVVCATRGELGPIAEPALVAGASLGDVRERELRASCAALGVLDVRVLGLPDAGVDWAAELQGTLEQLVLLIRQLRPDAIVTFGADGLYGHSDHVAIGELVTSARAAAARPEQFGEQLTSGALCAHQGARLFFPVITAQIVAEMLNEMRQLGMPGQLWSLAPADFKATAEQVTGTVDVSRVFDQKLAALRSHRTQLEASHVFTRMPRSVALRFMGLECFRCAEGRPGDPFTG